MGGCYRQMPGRGRRHIMEFMLPDQDVQGVESPQLLQVTVSRRLSTSAAEKGVPHPGHLNC